MFTHRFVYLGSICDVLGLEEGLHIPHTWGSNWEQSVAKSIAERKLKATSPDQLATGTTVESEGCSTSNLISPPSLNFKFIIASDILLYVRYVKMYILKKSSLFLWPILWASTLTITF